MDFLMSCDVGCCFRDIALAVFAINADEKAARYRECRERVGEQWAKTGISGDTSQNGRWDNIRNAKHNGHPMVLAPECPGKVPRTGVFEFDYVSTTRPQDANLINMTEGAFRRLCRTLVLVKKKTEDHPPPPIPHGTSVLHLQFGRALHFHATGTRRQALLTANKPIKPMYLEVRDHDWTGSHHGGPRLNWCACVVCVDVWAALGGWLDVGCISRAPSTNWDTHVRLSRRTMQTCPTWVCWLRRGVMTTASRAMELTMSKKVLAPPPERKAQHRFYLPRRQPPLQISAWKHMPHRSRLDRLQRSHQPWLEGLVCTNTTSQPVCWGLCATLRTCLPTSWRRQAAAICWRP